jgi:septal ring factor EnvC (AmiA/AmiB activator)
MSAAGIEWLLGLLLLGGPAAAEPNPPPPIQEDLQGVGNDLDRERKLLEELSRESGSVLQTVSRINQEIGSAEARHQKAREALAELDEKRQEHQRQRDQAATEAQQAGGRLRQRLRALYKMGELGWMNLLFSAQSAEDVLLRLRTLKRLARTDHALIEDVRQSREVLALADRRLDEERLRLQSQGREVERQRQAAAAVRAERLKALQLLRGQAELHKKALKELEQARQKLLQVVATIEGRGATGKGFKSWQGRLPPPVEGGRLEVPFGRTVDPRFKTVTINQGVDLRAEAGAPVRAVYPGTVAFAEAFQGYGLLLILDHGGGYFSLYGHLERFEAAKGQRVKQGQAIGTVGETGSLKGSYLYFEVREGGKAVDPAEWVKLK